MDIAEKLLRLVEIPSTTGEEEEICDYLCERVGESPGYRVQRVGHSFALCPEQRSSRPLVGLVGHLDTVPPSAGNAPRSDGERIWGRGAADMKSGVALMWELVERPVKQAAYDLVYLFYSGEEGPYKQSGLGPLLERVEGLEQIGLAFCLEPSDNVVQLGCMGNIHAEVTFSGRAAHSARPWEGENAIHKGAALLGRLARMPPREVEIEGLCFREVASVTVAQGGTAANMVPEAFRVNINYRFGPDRSSEDAQRVIAELVGEEGVVNFADLSPSGPIPRDNALLERFRARCAVPVAPKQAWTDVARLAEAGVPAVNFGPGEGAQAHQADESTSIELLRQGERYFRDFLADS